MTARSRVHGRGSHHEKVLLNSTVAVLLMIVLPNVAFLKCDEITGVHDRNERKMDALDGITFMEAANSSSRASCLKKGSTNKRIICYIRSGDEGFNAKDLDPCLCTHLVFGPAILNASGNEFSKDYWDDVKSASEFKKVNPTILILSSVIGTDLKLLKNVSRASSIQDTANMLVRNIKNNELDGLDMRWEYQNSEEENDPKFFQDHSNILTSMLKTLRSAMDNILPSHCILSLTISRKVYHLLNGYKFEDIIKFVDYFNLPAFQFSQNDLNITQHPSRLQGIADMDNVDSLVDLLISFNIPKNKLVIGIPTFGVAYDLRRVQSISKSNSRNQSGNEELSNTPRILSYPQVCSAIASGNWTKGREADDSSPYAYNDDYWIGYEDQISLKTKTKYLLLRNLGGISAWMINDDDSMGLCGQNTFPLLRSAHDILTEFNKPFEGFFNSDTHLESTESKILQIIDKEGKIQRLDARDSDPQLLQTLQCTRSGYFRFPKDCTRFYRCARYGGMSSNNYVVFLYECQHGLVFDEKDELCNWPSWSAPCQGSGEVMPVPQKTFTCPAAGYYPDTENCRWFFYCSEFGEGFLRAFEFRCPSALLGFDQEKVLCNWKWLVPGCDNAPKAKLRIPSHFEAESSPHHSFIHSKNLGIKRETFSLKDQEATEFDEEPFREIQSKQVFYSDDSIENAKARSTHRYSTNRTHDIQWDNGQMDGRVQSDNSFGEMVYFQPVNHQNRMANLHLDENKRRTSPILRYSSIHDASGRLNGHLHPSRSREYKPITSGDTVSISNGVSFSRNTNPYVVHSANYGPLANSPATELGRINSSYYGNERHDVSSSVLNPDSYGKTEHRETSHVQEPSTIRGMFFSLLDAESIAQFKNNNPGDNLPLYSRHINTAGNRESKIPSSTNDDKIFSEIRSGTSRNLQDSVYESVRDLPEYHYESRNQAHAIDDARKRKSIVIQLEENADSNPHSPFKQLRNDAIGKLDFRTKESAALLNQDKDIQTFSGVEELQCVSEVALTIRGKGVNRTFPEKWILKRSQVGRKSDNGSQVEFSNLARHDVPPNKLLPFEKIEYENTFPVMLKNERDLRENHKENDENELKKEGHYSASSVTYSRTAQGENFSDVFKGNSTSPRSVLSGSREQLYWIDSSLSEETNYKNINRTAPETFFDKIVLSNENHPITTEREGDMRLHNVFRGPVSSPMIFLNNSRTYTNDHLAIENRKNKESLVLAKISKNFPEHTSENPEIAKNSSVSKGEISQTNLIRNTQILDYLTHSGEKQNLNNHSILLEVEHTNSNTPQYGILYEIFNYTPSSTQDKSVSHIKIDDSNDMNNVTSSEIQGQSRKVSDTGTERILSDYHREVHLTKVLEKNNTKNVSLPSTESPRQREQFTPKILQAPYSVSHRVEFNSHMHKNPSASNVDVESPSLTPEVISKNIMIVGLHLMNTAQEISSNSTNEQQELVGYKDRRISKPHVTNSGDIQSDMNFKSSKLREQNPIANTSTGKEYNTLSNVSSSESEMSNSQSSNSVPYNSNLKIADVSKTLSETDEALMYDERDSADSRIFAKEDSKSVVNSRIYQDTNSRRGNSNKGINQTPKFGDRIGAIFSLRRNRNIRNRSRTLTRWRKQERVPHSPNITADRVSPITEKNYGYDKNQNLRIPMEFTRPRIPNDSNFSEGFAVGVLSVVSNATQMTEISAVQVYPKTPHEVSYRVMRINDLPYRLKESVPLNLGFQNGYYSNNGSMAKVGEHYILRTVGRNYGDFVPEDPYSRNKEDITKKRNQFSNGNNLNLNERLFKSEVGRSNSPINLENTGLELLIPAEIKAKVKETGDSSSRYVFPIQPGPLNFENKQSHDHLTKDAHLESTVQYISPNTAVPYEISNFSQTEDEIKHITALEKLKNFSSVWVKFSSDRGYKQAIQNSQEALPKLGQAIHGGTSLVSPHVEYETSKVEELEKFGDSLYGGKTETEKHNLNTENFGKTNDDKYEYPRNREQRLTATFSVSQEQRDHKNTVDDTKTRNKGSNEKEYSGNVDFTVSRSSPENIPLPRMACTRAGLFYHPTNCNKFYECYWDRWLGKFTLHIFHCPVKLVFDDRIFGCSYPEWEASCVNGKKK